MDIEKDLNKYLVYTTSTKDIVNNIYIGQIDGDSIMPVTEGELKYFDNIVEKVTSML